MSSSRRDFLTGLAAVSVAAATSKRVLAAAESIVSPFRVAVISDEITQDFGRALEIIANDFGLQWVELRGMWDKSLINLDAKEVDEARKLLERYRLRVTDIASPLFKVDWPDAPRSKFSPQRDTFGADFTFKQQNEVLERAIELAHIFKTDGVRCFDFWRLDDPGPYRAAIDAKLLAAAQKAEKQDITLLLENEYACNTATSAEAARTLNAVRSKYLKLVWDPGNAARRGDKPYPDGYQRLPKKRIGHIHCKDAKPAAAGNDYEWARMGAGAIDWLGQFRALKRDGYHLGLSLETHWRGAGTPEASTRQSMAGMQKLLREAGAA